MEECTKVNLNYRTTFYFDKLAIPRHAKVYFSTTKLQASGISSAQRNNAKYRYNVRLFINKGRNYAENCHQRKWDDSEIVKGEVESGKLNSQYYYVIIGELLHEVFNSIYWRYGMSLVIVLEPHEVNSPLSDLTNPWILVITYNHGKSSFFFFS